LLNYLLHRQLRMVSLISGLRRMLQHWPEDAVDPTPCWPPCCGSWDRGCDKLRIARLMAPFVARSGDDYRCQAFWLRLRHFCWSYLECQRWLERLARHDGQEWPAPPRHSSLTSHTDGLEAAYNGGVPSSA
jgi:hypothetical protein